MTVIPRNPRYRLLIGASLAALTVFGTGSARAQNMGERRTVDPAVAAAQAAQGAATRNAQAAAAAQRTRASFEAASRVRAQMDAHQSAARAAARLAQTSVPNGLGAGGLQPASGITLDPSLWVGANGPTQAQGADGRTGVTVDQTQEKAILTWETFNVGRETDLTFNHRGNNSWVTLNRVKDPNANPTQILGSIKADGSVYIINPNGIIFGGASQINVRNLIASTLEVHGGSTEWYRPQENGANISDERWAELKREARDKRFMDGLFSRSAQEDGQYRGDITFWDGVSSGLSQEELYEEVANAAQSAAPRVRIEAGAQIQAANSGMVALVGRNVDNSGSITAPSGQVLLAAGRAVTMIDGNSRSFGPIFRWEGDSRTAADLLKIPGYIGAVQQGGRVTNDGLLTSTRGNISMVGAHIRQDGVIAATTSLDKPGSIILTATSATILSGGMPRGDGDAVGLGDWRGTVAIGGNAHMSILPDASGQTSPGSAFTPSTVEIIGNPILFEKGATLYAPGGNVHLTSDQVVSRNGKATAGRIHVDSGATIDVSGLNGIEIDMEQNSIKAELRANELADNPVVRDGVLRGETVWFDGRLGEKLSDGKGVADLSGWYDLIARDVEQFMTVGGSVTMKGAEIITREGSRIDLSGGSVRYNDGFVRRTRLIDPFGRLVAIEDADAGVNYVGLEGDHIVSHARWGVTERFENPFSRVSRGSWQQGYVEGRSAGRLILHAGGPTGNYGDYRNQLSFTGDLARIFDGTVAAELVIGESQRDAPSGAGVTDVSRIWRERPSLARLSIGEIVSNQTQVNGGDIVIADRETLLDISFTADSALFDTSTNFSSMVEGVTAGRHVLSADWFDGKTFGDVSIIGGDGITGLYTRTGNTWVLKEGAPSDAIGGRLVVGEGVTVNLGDHGRFSFVGRRAEIDGTILAAGGTVTIEGTRLPGLGYFQQTPFNTIPEELRPGILLGANGRIDVAGRWTNHYLEARGGNPVTNAVIDGGSVRLFGHRIDLAKGSVIDVSGGARIATDGKTLTLGDGGSVTLDADTSSIPGLGRNGSLASNGELRGHAPGKGGTLNVYLSDEVIVGASLGRLEVIGDGVLQAGEVAPQDLELVKDFIIPAGDPMPIERIFSSANISPGATIDANTELNSGSEINVAAEWQVPDGLIFAYYDYETWDFVVFNPGDTVPAGTNGTLQGVLAAAYVFPADAFPNGLVNTYWGSPYPVTQRFAKGEVFDFDIVFAAGSSIDSGTVLPYDISVVAPRLVAADHFNQGGFANFGLTGARGMTILAGTVIAPTVDGLQLGGTVRDLATGTRLMDVADAPGSGVTRVNSASLPEWQRQASDLVLGSQPTLFEGYRQTSRWSPYGGANLTYSLVNMEAGAEIRMANESRVMLNGTTNLFVDGLIEAKGGQILLQKDQAQQQGTQTRTVIGDNARLLAGGYQKVAGYVDGQPVRTVAAGGTIRINSGDGGQGTPMVLIGSGAVMDVSGIAGVADLPRGGPVSRRRADTPYVATPMDGAAGDIIIKAENGVIAGNFRLAPGGETGRGGRLAFTGQRNAFVIHGFIDDLEPVTVDSIVPEDTIALAADRISASGADDLTIGGFAPYSFFADRIRFEGDVRLSARRSVVIESGGFLATPDDERETHVSLEAAYVRIGGSIDGQALAQEAVAERNSLSVTASTIDLSGAVNLGSGSGDDGFATADFRADGDIRLVATRNGSGGGLVTGGTIRFESAQTYVAPGVNAGYDLNIDYQQYDLDENWPGFLVSSPVSVTVQGNGGRAQVPLSWGGRVTLRAPEILQAGVLRAPLGSIVLDATDSFDAEGNEVAGRLTLAPGSLTSVSAEGLTMLAGLMTSNSRFYGYVREDWAPSKAVVLTGGNVDLQKGAVVDLSGGGDVRGYTFSSGTTGITNILNEDAPDAAFAILPGYDGILPVPFAASAIAGEAGWASSNPTRDGGMRTGLSDPRLRIGDQVYLQDVPGLAAGYYTLLPAAYAMLDGAMLVKPSAGVLSAGAHASQRRDDGSIVVSGYRAVGGSPIRPDQGWSSFQVMDAATWKQYGAYTVYSFNEMRAATNADKGLLVRTPHDAGRLVIDARKALGLSGEARLAGGSGATQGLAGDIDISSSGGSIALVGAGQSAPDGFLNVDAPTLQAFAGSGSLLIGGRRPISTRVEGDSGDPANFPGISESLRLVTTATDVWIGDGVTYNGLELLLAATDSISIGDGARLAASGTGRTNGSALDLSGDGALLRLSSGGRVGLVRTGSASQTGRIRLGDATMLSTEGALSLDASAGFDLAASAVLDVRQLDLASDRINIGDTPAEAAGTVLSRETVERLAAASDLSLRAHQAIVVWGDFTLGARGGDGKATLGALTFDTALIEGRANDGEGLTLTAGALTLRNSGAGSAPVAGSGLLTLDVDQLRLEDGAIGLSSYAQATGRIGELLASGKGSLTLGGHGDFTVGQASAANGAVYKVEALGNLALRQGGAAASAGGGSGGSLGFAGASLLFDTVARAHAGSVSLVVTGGSLDLGSQALIDVSGVAKTFVDTVRYAPGGIVRLSATGDITAHQDSLINVSGHERGGAAGVIDVSAGGAVHLAGGLEARSAEGHAGGEFMLDAGQADFAGLNAKLNAGRFTASRDIRLDQGITLAAGERIEAHDVTLRSDTGDIRIAGLIAASGNAIRPAGGFVSLHGENVVIEGTGRIEAAAAPVGAADFQPASGSVTLAADSGKVTLSAGSVIDLTGGREGGGRLVVRAARAGSGADAILDGQVTGAREKILIGSRIYAADTIDAGLIATALDEANGWLAGAPAPAGWQRGAGLIFRSQGDLTVSDVIDLAGVAGPGYLGFEAAGDLIIEADISDGFDGVGADAGLGTEASFNYGFEAGGDLRLGEMAPPPSRPFVAPGQAFDKERQLSAVVPVTVAADWVVPDNLYFYDSNFNYYYPGATLRAGSTIVQVNFGVFQPGYVLPADAFPNGLTFALEQTPFTGVGRTVRTGTGDISVRTGGSVWIGAESTIYTAGRATDTAAGFDRSPYVQERVSDTDLLLGEFPTMGGNLRLVANGDIHVSPIEQTPTAWLYRYGQATWSDDPAGSLVMRQTSWSIRHGDYHYGLGTLGGGDVNVRARGDIVDLAVALPTTGHLTSRVGERSNSGELVIRGGGDLRVRAFGDIGGGAYVLGKGKAEMIAGGSFTGGRLTQVIVDGESQVRGGGGISETRGMGALFGLMDAVVDVKAARGVEIEGAYDLALLPQVCANIAGSCDTIAGVGSAWVGLSGRAGVDAVAAGGDMVYRANGTAAVTLSRNNRNAGYRVWLSTPTPPLYDPRHNFVQLLHRTPGTLRLASLTENLRIEDGLTLSAAPRGTLELLAGKGMELVEANTNTGTAIIIENLAPEYIRDALRPVRAEAQIWIHGSRLGTIGNNFERGDVLLHHDDPDPVRIYALDGSIDVFRGSIYSNWGIQSPKALRVQASGDIGPGRLSVTHNSPTDLSTVIAGGDLFTLAGYAIYGPGDLWVEAGGNLVHDRGAAAIASAGNGSASVADYLSYGNQQTNHALPDIGADIHIVTGTAQGADYTAFADLYLDPANLADPAFGLSHPTNQGKVVHTYEKELEDFLAARGLTGITVENRRTLFDALPVQSRQIFLQRVLSEELRQTGIDYNDADGPRFQQYTRGYSALHLVYPGTADLERMNPRGGNVGLRNGIVQSMSGGSINIVAPYGEISVGDPTNPIPPNNAGVLTRRGGNLTMIANGTISLDQSRAFTLQGGNLTMWTSKGDITAGTGAKTNVTNVPLSFRLDKNGLLGVNVFGLQTGPGSACWMLSRGATPTGLPAGWTFWPSSGRSTQAMRAFASWATSTSPR